MLKWKLSKKFDYSSAVVCSKGDGSGAGGSINQAGDKFGEIEAAQESAYFKKLVSCFGLKILFNLFFKIKIV